MSASIYQGFYCRVLYLLKPVSDNEYYTPTKRRKGIVHIIIHPLSFLLFWYSTEITIDEEKCREIWFHAFSHKTITKLKLMPKSFVDSIFRVRILNTWPFVMLINISWILDFALTVEWSLSIPIGSSEA